MTLDTGELERWIREIAVTAREDLQHARAAAVERFARLFEHAPIGIALLDEWGTIAEANSALERMLGCQPNSLRGTSLPELAAGERDASTLRNGLDTLLRTATPQELTRIDFRHAVDERHRTNVTLITLPSDTPEREYPLLLVEDVNYAHSLGETLLHQNVHDALTGLPNAASFDNQMEAALADRAHPQVALVLFDLDGFRVINDGLGSNVGDALLRAVANKLRNAFSQADATVARLTGDGFGVLLRGELTPTEVMNQVEAALGELSEPIYIEGEPVGVNASAGIVLQNTGQDTAADLKRKGETTLHRAKDQGRSQWIFYDDAADARDRRRFRMAASLSGALENGQFELVYQPTVTLDGSDALPVVDAVLRWHHPEFGTVTSDEILPLADTTGMTLPIGRWMLSDALTTRASWGATLDGPVPDVCLRLPARLAIDDKLVGMVKDRLAEHALDASTLRLCVAPSTALDPRGEALESLGVLRELSIWLVLEVTAATDLELIRKHRLPVDCVMLSGGIVDSVDHDNGSWPSSARHLEHLIASASELGLIIGAQGVRTTEQAERLGALGVRAARGPFYLEPSPADRIATLLAERAG
ncbi:diguanylate cyclase domain-containing protein [Haloechinothrix sp. LS1_15]|uniref:diguanylate cyclase domain-containing protein n=1 Tax=Haloechinothrix sp. LS1_15 TaxID=2652248 RepID=UPI00294ADD87|nr:diguanylate cyclase [Haloechinothrix sp. LS1_15]